MASSSSSLHFPKMLHPKEMTPRSKDQKIIYFSAKPEVPDGYKQIDFAHVFDKDLSQFNAAPNATRFPHQVYASEDQLAIALNIPEVFIYSQNQDIKKVYQINMHFLMFYSVLVDKLDPNRVANIEKKRYVTFYIFAATLYKFIHAFIHAATKKYHKKNKTKNQCIQII